MGLHPPVVLADAGKSAPQLLHADLKTVRIGNDLTNTNTPYTTEAGRLSRISML